MQDNPNYSYIGTVKTPDGGTHYVKDAEARTAITAIENRVDLAEEDIGTLKAAVKGGDRLSDSEIQALLIQMQQTGASPTCPHGRPVSRTLTRRDIEKLFKRIQ